MEQNKWEWFTQFAGIEMAHNYYVHHIISNVIDKNPSIGQIIEIGTFKGAMTVAVGLNGLRKNIPVFTFDIQKQTSDETDMILDRLAVSTHFGEDVFAIKNYIIGIIKRCPTYLICDGGNKRDEFPAFGRELLPGSIISVHDWGTEFIPEYAHSLNDKIEPFEPDDWTNHDCRFATWRIIA